MNGEQNLEIDDFFALIDKWCENNLLNINPNIDQDILNEIFNIDDISNLPIDELNNIIFRLTKFLYHIQGVYNRERAISNYASLSIYEIICDIDLSDNDKYLKAEEKYAKKINMSEFTKKLYKLYVNANSKVILFESRINTIEKMIETISNINRRKVFKNDN